MIYVFVAVVILMTKQFPLMQDGKPEEVVGTMLAYLVCIQILDLLRHMNKIKTLLNRINVIS